MKVTPATWNNMKRGTKVKCVYLSGSNTPHNRSDQTGTIVRAEFNDIVVIWDDGCKTSCYWAELTSFVVIEETQPSVECNPFNGGLKL